MSEACVILAAGAGQRMGRINKALLMWQDKSFLAHIAGICEKTAVREVVVVVADPHALATEAAAQSLGLVCVFNATPERGMAGSVAVGFDFALRTFSSEACWLWPVDTPAVASKTLENLRSHSEPRTILTPRFEGRGGHPSLVGREFWQELASCECEPEGARTVFHRAGERRQHLDVEDPGVCHDVDRRADMGGFSC